MIRSKMSSYTIDHGTIVSLATKRHKAGISVSTKDGKEKFGERISALQQLVSPFRKELSVSELLPTKTDTASVLLDAMEYIQFLHEQVKVPVYVNDDHLLIWYQVLSAPYLQCSPAQEWDHYSLRSRGLCAVPISCTEGVDQINGADLWAPMKITSPSPMSDKAIPQLQ